MKIVLLITLQVCCFFLATAPPVSKKKEKAPPDDGIDPLEWTNKMEYKTYLMEVLSELERDKDFQKRVEKLKDENNTASVADQLEFASHNVRTRLDEIKRREVDRLNSLEAKLESLEGKQDSKEHVDHSNPHSFEIKDLKKLIEKVSSDLVTVEAKQEDEFKRYEMEKEVKRKKKLSTIKDKKLRDEEIHRFEESKKRHSKHEKIHHPGSEEHLKDIWEKEDHLDRDSFDPKTFFSLHDKDSNGHLDEEEMDALMMRELDKAYEEGNPDDDVMERYHEMNRMRQELMREIDTNHDRMISYDEFKHWTKTKNYKEDSGWKTTEESDKPVYTDEELRDFTKSYFKEHPEERFEDFGDHEDGKVDTKPKMTKEMDQTDTVQTPSQTEAKVRKPAVGAGSKL